MSERLDRQTELACRDAIWKRLETEESSLKLSRAARADLFQSGAEWLANESKRSERIRQLELERDRAIELSRLTDEEMWHVTAMNGFVRNHIQVSPGNILALVEIIDRLTNRTET